MIAHDYHAMDLEPGKVLYETKYVWELPVRLTHWIIAASIFILFATGLYIASPVAGPRGEPYNNFFMGRVRETHFIAAYVFLFAMLVRLYWFFVGNRYATLRVPAGLARGVVERIVRADEGVYGCDARAGSTGP